MGLLSRSRTPHARPVVQTPTHTAWRREVQRHSFRKGKAQIVMLEKPQVLTYIWVAWNRDEANRKILEDAKTVLGCRLEEVVMFDEGRRKTCWQLNGKHADVAVYTWVGGGA